MRPAIIALALAVLVGPDTRAEDLTHVRDLVDRLGDDDFATREKATADLIALGRAALPEVRAARKSTSSAEVRERATVVLESYLDTEGRKRAAKEFGLEGRPHSLQTKSMGCMEDLERFFPEWSFRFVLEPGFDPIGVVALSPEDEVEIYRLGEDHKGSETELQRIIRRAGVVVRDRETAQRFGVLWLFMAYAADGFAVEETDHQELTRY